MPNYVDQLPSFVDDIESIKETIITNIVLAPTRPAARLMRASRSRTRATVGGR